MADCSKCKHYRYKHIGGKLGTAYTHIYEHYCLLHKIELTGNALDVFDCEEFEFEIQWIEV